MSTITDNGIAPGSPPPPDSVTGAEVVDGSLTGDDIAPNSIPQGDIIGLGTMASESKDDYVEIAGDTMTGNLNMGGNSVLNAANLFTTNTSQVNITGNKEMDTSGLWQWKGTFGGAPKEFRVNPAGSAWAVELLRFGSPAWRISGTGMENYGLTRLFNGGIDLLRSVSAPVTGQINVGRRSSLADTIMRGGLFNVSFDSMILSNDGISFGPGTAAVDTELKRTAPNEWSIGVTDRIVAQSPPTVDGHLANKKYVDDSVGAVDLSSRVAVAGDTMTGDLTLGTNVDIVFGDNSRIEAVTGTLTGAWLRSRATADTADRMFIERGGQINWGGGTGAADVTLERIAASTLGLGAGDQIQVQQDPVVDNDLARKKYVDDTVAGVSGTYVDEAGDTMTGNLTMSNNADIVLGLSSQIQHLNANSPGSDWVRTNATVDTQDRFRMTVSGTMRWGSGSAATDVILERGGADHLRMGSGDQLRIQQDPVNDDDAARKAYVDSKSTTRTQQYVTANGTTAVSATANTVVVNQTVPGAATIQLPASPAAGRHLNISKRSATGGGNNVDISPNGNTINGNGSNLVLNQQYDNFTLEWSADTNDWMIL